jgi:hypothetical protein
VVLCISKHIVTTLTLLIVTDRWLLLYGTAAEQHCPFNSTPPAVAVISCAVCAPVLLLQVLQFEQQYLDALPCAQMYEKSYMHRDTVTHVVVSEMLRAGATGAAAEAAAAEAAAAEAAAVEAAAARAAAASAAAGLYHSAAVASAAL